MSAQAPLDHIADLQGDAAYERLMATLDRQFVVYGDLVHLERPTK